MEFGRKMMLIHIFLKILTRVFVNLLSINSDKNTSASSPRMKVGLNNKGRAAVCMAVLVELLLATLHATACTENPSDPRSPCLLLCVSNNLNVYNSFCS